MIPRNYWGDEVRIATQPIRAGCADNRKFARTVGPRLDLVQSVTGQSGREGHNSQQPICGKRNRGSRQFANLIQRTDWDTGSAPVSCLCIPFGSS